MRRIHLVFLMLLLVCGAVSASGLPPVHEAARLNLAVESAVKNKQWQKAKALIDSLRLLDVKQPLNSYYYEGLVLSHLQRMEAARRILEKYVVEGGDKGDFYNEALTLITEAQDVSNDKVATPTVLSEISKAGEKNTDGYIKSLQALYLVDNEVDALVMQVNSLLNAHPYTGKRIKRSDRKQGVVYKFSAKHNEMTVRETSYEKGLPSLKASTFSVLGMNPFVKYECAKDEYACWVFNPANDHRRWLMIDYDEMVANELASALSKLIIVLQKR